MKKDLKNKFRIFNSGNKLSFFIITVVLFLIIMASVNGLYAMSNFFYSRDVRLIREFSGGLIHENNIYFLINWKLFRRPQGIARFPDGGRVKQLFYKTFLYRYSFEDEQPVSLFVVCDDIKPGSNLRFSHFELNDDILHFIYISSHGDIHAGGSENNPAAWTPGAWNLKTEREVAVDENRKEELMQVVRENWVPVQDMKFFEVKRMLEDLPLEIWDLPLPDK